jgi:acyl-CoA synthetase (NDP forming)
VEAELQAVWDGFAGEGDRDRDLRMNEMEVYRLLDTLGLARCPAVAWELSTGNAGCQAWAAVAACLADEQGRVLLKVLGREILHKTEAGGVSVLTLPAGTGRPAALAAAADEMAGKVARRVPAGQVEGVLACAFVPHQANRPGQEVLLSLRQDPAFGPCVIVGIGGTLTEWYAGAGAGPASPGSTLVFPAQGLTADVVETALTAHPMLRLLCLPSRLYATAPLDPRLLVQSVLALAAAGERCGPDGSSSFTLEEIEINPAVASLGALVALDGVGLVSRRKWRPVVRSVGRIKSLLAPRSAVVLGASAKGANPGRIILDNLVKSAGIDQERLYAVHHQEQTISGVRCFPDVASLPEACDLAVVAIPAEGALAAIAELVAADKAASIILIPGGFAETGRTDLAEAIEESLRLGHSRPQGGPVLVGGNCLGIVSRDNYNTFFLPEYKLPFSPGRGENLALVSQSGAYLVTFASNTDGVIQPRAAISFGNQMDLTVADFLCHFNAVPEVNVIACYIEGFRPGDGARFLAECGRARELGKRVVVFKAGKTALGAQAAASHTASLAGDYAVARACLVQAGVTVAESLDEFEDLIKTFTLLAAKPAAGVRTGIISNAGFECSTVMDRLDGLELARFPAETQSRLDELLPGYAHRSNPIDCTPMTGTEAYCGACAEILACPAVDAAILASVPVTPALDNLPADPAGSHRENLAAPGSQPRLMVDIIAGSTKPAVVVVDSGRIYDPMCRLIERAGIPVFRKIDRAAQALAAFCRS